MDTLKRGAAFLVSMALAWWVVTWARSPGPGDAPTLAAPRPAEGPPVTREALEGMGRGLRAVSPPPPPAPAGGPSADGGAPAGGPPPPGAYVAPDLQPLDDLHGAGDDLSMEVPPPVDPPDGQHPGDPAGVAAALDELAADLGACLGPPTGPVTITVEVQGGVDGDRAHVTPVEVRGAEVVSPDCLAWVLTTMPVAMPAAPFVVAHALDTLAPDVQ